MCWLMLFSEFQGTHYDESRLGQLGECQGELLWFVFVGGMFVCVAISC